ncbi:hypothetical protein J2X43_003504 [Rhizobium sp. BE258]|nr:hypothetical protein [Rhizobium sp. BE258]
MSPEYVRPYVKAQKNDDRDAEGIAEAASRRVQRLVAELRDEWKMLDTKIAALNASSWLWPEIILHSTANVYTRNWSIERHSGLVPAPDFLFQDFWPSPELRNGKRKASVRELDWQNPKCWKDRLLQHSIQLRLPSGIKA